MSTGSRKSISEVGGHREHGGSLLVFRLTENMMDEVQVKTLFPQQADKIILLRADICEWGFQTAATAFV